MGAGWVGRCRLSRRCGCGDGCSQALTRLQSAGTSPNSMLRHPKPQPGVPVSLVKRLINRPVGWESKKDMGRRTTQASSRSCMGIAAEMVCCNVQQAGLHTFRSSNKLLCGGIYINLFLFRIYRKGIFFVNEEQNKVKKIPRAVEAACNTCLGLCSALTPHSLDSVSKACTPAESYTSVSPWHVRHGATVAGWCPLGLIPAGPLNPRPWRTLSFFLSFYTRECPAQIPTPPHVQHSCRIDGAQHQHDCLDELHRGCGSRCSCVRTLGT